MNKMIRLMAIGFAISTIGHFLDALIDLTFRGYTRVVYVEPILEVRIVEIILYAFGLAYFIYEFWRVLRE